MVLAAAAFMLIAFAQARLAGGLQVSIGWQLLAYVILTASEVMVSITALELAYTHAPSVSKSLVTSFYLLSVALGNGVTAGVTAIFERLALAPDSALYFTAFALLALIATVPVGLFSARSSCQGTGS
jgi:POT family proton-dependent oligopeptide transporter